MDKFIDICEGILRIIVLVFAGLALPVGIIIGAIKIGLGAGIEFVDDPDYEIRKFKEKWKGK
ncbi:MAG: hypothetical protein ACW99A_22595 [Candidatus Kariarchaeaceae archaeon]|jgi:hypothetical protein